MLGENILKLRKKKNLSQEQLGEKVNVTRQTISNWELGETTPNPEQLKLLSKALNISVDELLDNDIRGILETKVSNTEKLAGIIIKILKAIGILFLIFLVIDIISLILFTVLRTNQENFSVETVEMSCSLNNQKYAIEFGTDNFYVCNNCSNEINKDLKDIVDSNTTEDSIYKIEQYFINNNGICE
ncbi:MAG: helix-turn-helix domain-containing protein [Clostridium sp.]|nr:helix-turn-helix domain-containing protein [Clostridium sp.]MCM1444088.1 helix-turn-helix domain-containing protein [Candidatus Amulumruptor caecigallinarius]